MTKERVEEVPWTVADGESRKVWKTGVDLKPVSITRTWNGYYGASTSETVALRRRSEFLKDHDYYATHSDVYETTLEQVFADARADGAIGVRLYSETGLEREWKL